MITIKKATESNFPEVFILLKQLFSEDKLSKLKTKNIFVNNMKNKNSIDLVVYSDKKIIGYGSVTIREDIQSQGKVGYLSELIIDESHRGKGYGSKLLDEIIKTCEGQMDRIPDKPIEKSINQFKQKKAVE